MNESLASGLPVRVARRRPSTKVSSSGSRSSVRQASGGRRAGQRAASTSPRRSRPVQWASALDHGYIPAWRTVRARTGLRST